MSSLPKNDSHTDKDSYTNHDEHQYLNLIKQILDKGTYLQIVEQIQLFGLTTKHV